MWPGGSTRRMIESALTDLPLPDSPTMPSVRPPPSVKSTPSTARIGPACDSNQVRRFATSRRFAIRSGPLRDRRRDRDCDVLLERARPHGRLPRLHRREQLAVLARDPLEVADAPVAEEVRADARRDRAPELGAVLLPGVREHELVEADVGLDGRHQVVATSRLAHQPDLLREL